METIQTQQINTIYIDNAGMHESKLETLDKLHVALAASEITVAQDITEADAMHGQDKLLNGKGYRASCQFRHRPTLASKKRQEITRIYNAMERDTRD